MHTPGPWSVGGKYTHKSVLLNARGESIASGGNNRAVQGQELEDSLRLAAAAPELLSALIAVMGRVPPDLERADVDMNRAMSIGRAAIAKAQG
jgi:hypothetical protein